MRLGEAEHALDLLNEAEPTFTDRAQYERRRVQAYALMGRVADALPLARGHLARQPEDVDILYLTMHMIYETFASGERSDASELDRFRDYAARYIVAEGPQIQVVQGWRKALGIR